MNVHEAVAQIEQIQAHLQRTETFRGYRSQTLALSGLLAVIGSLIQMQYIAEPLQALQTYLALWLGIATCSASGTALELMNRCRVSGSLRAVRSTRSALLKLVLSLTAGALLTQVIVTHAIEVAWMLPGLWSILFSLGVFASMSMLPRGVVWIGVHYLITGLFCLVAGLGDQALAPWTMLLTFGAGQFLSAGLLYLTLERPND